MANRRCSASVHNKPVAPRLDPSMWGAAVPRGQLHNRQGEWVRLAYRLRSSSVPKITDPCTVHASAPRQHVLRALTAQQRSRSRALWGPNPNCLTLRRMLKAAGSDANVDRHSFAIQMMCDALICSHLDVVMRCPALCFARALSQLYCLRVLAGMSGLLSLRGCTWPVLERIDLRPERVSDGER